MLARVIVTIVLLLLPTAGFAQAEKRVALVIGNSAYQHTPKLTNPSNDAADMAAALKRHGFKVIEGVDLDKPGFDRKVRDFATALKGSEVGLFFYAGHGLQVAGQNYLVPVDGKAESADALEFEMIRVDPIHRIMERQTNTDILFLHACRDNPLVRNLARSMGTRSSEVGHGLAPIESGVGTLISFSTQPGNVALDGTGRNSPFAGALAKHLSNANDDLGAILIAVRNDVMRETQRKQVPWEHSALTGRFYFGVPRAAPDQAAELAAWNAVKDSGDPGTIRTYLDRYPQGTYAVVALNLIAALEKQRQTETELETHRQGLAKTREDMRKAQEAALKTVPNKPAPAAPGTYDGTWKVTGVGDARCNIRNWSGSIDIDGTQIISRSTKQGRLTSDGNFTFYMKAQIGDDGLYEGRIEGDVGKGTYFYKSNSCAGIVVLKKMTVAGEGGAQVTLAQPPVCGSSATAIPGKCLVRRFFPRARHQGLADTQSLCTGPSRRSQHNLLFQIC